jgi:hypothetical protein
MADQFSWFKFISGAVGVAIVSVSGIVVLLYIHSKDNRAWLKLSVINARLTIGSKAAATELLQNVGKSPADHIHVWHHVWALRRNLGWSDEAYDREAKYVVDTEMLKDKVVVQDTPSVPASESWSTIVQSEDLIPETLQNLANTRDIRFYVIGEYTYDTGGWFQQRGRTRYCYFLTGNWDHPDVVFCPYFNKQQ